MKKYLIFSDRNPQSGGVAIFAEHFIKYLKHFQIEYEERELGEPKSDCINIYTVLYLRPSFILKRSTICVVIHDLQHRTHPDNFNRYQRFTREFKLRVISLLNIKVITESLEVEERLRHEYGFNDVNRITCFFPNILRKPKTYRFESGLINILYPAKDWPHKRISELVGWVRKYNLRADCSKLVLHLTNVNNVTASDDVVVHGLLSSDDLYELYSRSDLVYINSESESVSLPVFEAWQHGKLVACSSYPWSISQSQNGRLTLLNHTNDYNGFIDVIKQIQTNHHIKMRLDAQKVLLEQKSKFWI